MNFVCIDQTGYVFKPKSKSIDVLLQWCGDVSGRSLFQMNRGYRLPRKGTYKNTLESIRDNRIDDVVKNHKL